MLESFYSCKQAFVDDITIQGGTPWEAWYLLETGQYFENERGEIVEEVCDEF